jgi:low temperature requirement protein LtrA
MTPEDHNRYLGIAHVAYGALHVLIMLLVGVIVFAMVALNTGRSDAPPAAFMTALMLVIVGINVLLAVPSFIAGYAFLKKKRWAKVAGIVAAVLSALRIPFGTVVAIYTFWFLFSAPGKVLYDNLAQALPPAPPVWNEVGRTRKTETYVPPASPPDWR